MQLALASHTLAKAPVPVAGHLRGLQERARCCKYVCTTKCTRKRPGRQRPNNKPCRHKRPIDNGSRCDRSRRIGPHPHGDLCEAAPRLSCAGKSLCV
jgi:hypothetical protein